MQIIVHTYCEVIVISFKGNSSLQLTSYFETDWIWPNSVSENLKSESVCIASGRGVKLSIALSKVFIIENIDVQFKIIDSKR